MATTIVRPAVPGDGEAIAEVHVTAWLESYGRIVPDSVLAAQSIPARIELWRRILGETPRQPIYVAEREGRLVGFVNGGPCRGEELGQDMEVYAIYLLAVAKRRGIGGRLLRTIVADFLVQGAKSAGVWALRDNIPARRFYESLDARLTTEKIDHRPGYDLIEVGYIWPDLRESFPT